YRQLLRLNPRAIGRRRQGDVLLRFVGDLGALRRWLSLGLARLTVSGVLIGLTFVALAMINLVLAGLVFAALGAGLLLTLLLGPALEAAIRQARRRRSRMAAQVAETAGALLTVQAGGQSRRERRRLRKQSRAVRSAEVRRAWLLGALRGIADASVRLATLLALIVGAWQVMAGRATAGTVVAAMSVVAFIAPPVRELSRVYDFWQSARVSREKISAFLNAGPVIAGPRRKLSLPPGGGRLEFRRVAVDGALQRVSYSATPGQLIRIEGPNGAGKSTLLALAARLLDPDRGRVLLDGRPLRRVPLAELRRAVGVLSPDLPLLKGTVESNVRYRWPTAPDAEVDRVCAQCGVDRAVRDLPGQRGAAVAEGGRNLSVGQRQCIALARAILGTPRLLLLDEPDNGLDAGARSALERVVQAYPGTVLLASHVPLRQRTPDAVWTLRPVGRAAPPALHLAARNPQPDLSHVS
ncbi:MAG: ABC transporter ATP-binding protein, partial [Gammaproteobacteria bacterium]|nr:ABC transporter ATP-binding protein [Gammaproteobacteria bacterium]